MAFILLRLLLMLLSLFLSDPGKARGCSTNTFVIDWLIDWFVLKLKYLYGAVTPKQFKMVLPVIKQTIFTFFKDSKSWRASKPLYRFKSYGNFAERVNFAYWWSCIGKGLRLQACLISVYFVGPWPPSPIFLYMLWFPFACLSVHVWKPCFLVDWRLLSVSVRFGTVVATHTHQEIHCLPYAGFGTLHSFKFCCGIPRLFV